MNLSDQPQAPGPLPEKGQRALQPLLLFLVQLPFFLVEFQLFLNGLLEALQRREGGEDLRPLAQVHPGVSERKLVVRVVARPIAAVGAAIFVL